MIRIERTTPDHPDFIELVTYLDRDLKTRDGDEHAFFAQFNGIDGLKKIYRNKSL